MQHGVIDLDIWVLQFKSHHVQDVVQLALIRHKRFAMIHPWGHIASGNSWPGIAPAIAVQVAIAGHNDRLASGVGDADKRLCAMLLTVLIKAN